MKKIDLKQLISETRDSIYKLGDLKAPRLLGKIGAIVMNPDENTERYLKAKFKEFTDYGHEVIITRMPSDSMLHENAVELAKLMVACDAVLVQEPHPFSKELNHILGAEGIEEYACADIENCGKYDPTSESVVRILESLGTSGDETIAVLGAGMFGKAIANTLMSEKYTVLSCNSRTKDVEMLRNIADYTVLAFGKGELTPIWGEKIIDVSFNIAHDNTIEYDYTPIVGGTGKMTTLILLEKFNLILEVLNNEKIRNSINADSSNDTSIVR